MNTTVRETKRALRILRSGRWAVCLLLAGLYAPGHGAETEHRAAAGTASAPTPSARRDFEGTWFNQLPPGELPFSLGVDLPYKPKAQDLAADRMELFKKGTPIASAHMMCRPTGVQGVTAPKAVVLILQTPSEWLFISQEDREVRHVYLNQSHPKNLAPSYSGDAVGHWEGDTFVIDTIGFNGRGQLDEMGNPHSAQLHMLERLTLSADGGSFGDVVTFDDPVYYTKPFTKIRRFARTRGARVLDYDCAENPRSDDFDILKFENDWFKPVCVRPVQNDVASDNVVCRH